MVVKFWMDSILLIYLRNRLHYFKILILGDGNFYEIDIESWF